MKDKEIFDGFNITLVKKAKEGTSYFAAEEIVGKSIKNLTKNVQDVEKRGKAFYEKTTETAHAIFRELVHCIEKGLDPASVEVQWIIKKHHVVTEQLQNAIQDVYITMAQLYQERPEFRKQLDPFHFQLAEFIAQAMTIYADQNL